MSQRRRASCHLTFNGQDMDVILLDYLKSVTYTDVAGDASDDIEVTLQNIELDWLGRYYPKKGDAISGALFLFGWDGVGDRHAISLGTHILDSIKFSGGPLEATFGGVSIPADSSFRTREDRKSVV